MKRMGGKKIRAHGREDLFYYTNHISLFKGLPALLAFFFPVFSLSNPISPNINISAFNYFSIPPLC